jgi:hypothetical protein
MFRCPKLWSLLVVLVLGGAAPAQDVYEFASVEMVENALRGLRVQPTQRGESFAFTLDGRQFQVNRLDRGGRLLIQSSSRTKAPLEAINRYNERIAVTTRAVRYGKDNLVLEAGLDCRLGVTEAAVRKFITTFARDFQTFEQFVAKQRDVRTADNTPDPRIRPGVGEGVSPNTDPPSADPAVGKKPPVAVKPRRVPIQIAPGTDDRELEVYFPSATGAETGWKIVWDLENGEQANKQGFKFTGGRKNSVILFKIKKAYFRPGAKAPWIQVLEDAHPQEFYVPYYFQNTRFFDLRDVGNYVRLSPAEGSERSRLLGKRGMVMAELRDRGLAYKHGDTWRRGEELTLWANFQAGNYTYLVEFGFLDDGTIAFRHSPTGYNYFDHFDTASHMHNCLWRIGVKLAPPGGPAGHRVDHVRLPTDPRAQGPAGRLEINEVATECGLDWDAKEFTKLRVTNPDVSLFPAEGKNGRKPISYDLVATVQGQARHRRHKDEGFSLHDFWVTRADTPERMYVYLHNYFNRPGNPKPLAGADGVVFWHMSSALHIPRGEDGILQGNNLNNGQALTSWTVVELRPRNLFTRTPLYQAK